MDTVQTKPVTLTTSVTEAESVLTEKKMFFNLWFRTLCTYDGGLAGGP
jgi:hypothetical protein